MRVITILSASILGAALAAGAPQAYIPAHGLSGTLPVVSTAAHAGPLPSRHTAASDWGDVHINEAMARNTSTIADEDGEYSDWVELVNRGALPLNLCGCGLSDDPDEPFQWVLPDVVVPPGGYLLVWASGKNRTGSELHANFRLDADGEPVALAAPSGALIDLLPAGLMPEDISRGRTPDGTGGWVYFTDPTPGASNATTGYAAIAPTPEFSRKGGYFTGTLALTLQVASAAAVIRYTLDGSTPAETSPPYTAPLALVATATVQARAFGTNMVPSQAAGHRYLAAPPAALPSSDLPIVVVDTYGETIRNEPKISAFMGVIRNPAGTRNAITDVFNDFEGVIGIELRGKSSQTFPKKQYGVETRTPDNDDRDVALLGLPAESDWVLHAPYSDKTLMRNVLAYDLANRMGRYASRTRYCELVLNGSYQGVYVLMEKIKRGKQRVDIKKLAATDLTAPDVSGGYILKIDKVDWYDSTFTTSNGVQLVHVYPKGTDIQTQQRTWIRNYMNAFEAALNSTAFTNPASGYAAYIDVDSFVDHYILVQATKNIDGLRLSAYMYKDRNGPLVAGPAWDFNLSLGNANYLNGYRSNGWYTCTTGFAVPWWWDRMLQDPAFVRRCRDRWNELRAGVLDCARLHAFVDRTALTLAEAQQRNFQRWPILGTYVWPNWYIGQTYDQEVAWMRQWLVGRIGWIDAQWPIVIAHFTTDVQSVGADLPVRFHNLSAGAPCLQRWTFGDGGTSMECNPMHAYHVPGLYTVGLAVSNNLDTFGWVGNASVRTNYLEVVPEPFVGWCGLLLTLSVMREYCMNMRLPAN